MKQKEAVRDYFFPDASLIQKCDDVLNSINRDSNEFELRGYTQDKRDKFRDLRNTFDDLPLDSSLEGVKISATQQKDDFRNDLITKLRTIHSIFKNHYGTESGQYKELGKTYITRLTDEMLVRTAKSVKKTAEKYKDELRDEGLSDNLLHDIAELNVKLDDAIDIQFEAIKNRDVNTEERVLAGNRLYKELVKVCTIGKDIWYSVNEAKYNDYVIYNTPSGQKEDEPITPPNEPTV